MSHSTEIKISDSYRSYTIYSGSRHLACLLDVRVGEPKTLKGAEALALFGIVLDGPNIVGIDNNPDKEELSTPNLLNALAYSDRAIVSMLAHFAVQEIYGEAEHSGLGDALENSNFTVTIYHFD